MVKLALSTNMKYTFISCSWCGDNGVPLDYRGLCEQCIEYRRY